MYGREVNMKADREDRRKTTRTERRNQSEAEKLAHRDREARRNTRKIDLMIAGDEDATEAYRKKQRVDRERQELRTLNTNIGRMSRIKTRSHSEMRMSTRCKVLQNARRQCD